jgi:hypothetical protein
VACLETPPDDVARVDDRVGADVRVIADDELELPVTSASRWKAEDDVRFDDRTRSESAVRVNDRRAADGQADSWSNGVDGGRSTRGDPWLALALRSTRIVAERETWTRREVDGTVSIGRPIRLVPRRI